MGGEGRGRTLISGGGDGRKEGEMEGQTEWRGMSKLDCGRVNVGCGQDVDVVEEADREVGFERNVVMGEVCG